MYRSVETGLDKKLAKSDDGSFWHLVGGLIGLLWLFGDQHQIFR